MHIFKRRRDPERGAILIHVAIAIVVLIGFLTFVVDYGVMWVGRGQAQNAADAGALAGAVALAFDPNGWTDRDVTGPARTAAHQMALTNWVIGEAPDVDIATDVYFTDQPADMCPTDANGLTGCIRVDVYRNQERQNPLPSIFGQAFGITAYGVRATATARVAVADASDCLKPFAIPDKWEEHTDPPWDPDSTFDTEVCQGNTCTPLLDPDVYVPPTETDPGTGFTVEADIGVRIVLKAGGPQTAIAPGVFYPVRLPLPGGEISSGGDDYRDNIASCNGQAIEIGDTLLSENGNMVGPTAQGIGDLIALDEFAEWDPSTNSVVNSCAQSTSPCAARSPRIVAIPIFDTAAYYSSDRQSGQVEFTVVNILGFFIDDMQGNNVIGYLTSAPGLTVGEASINPESAFLANIQLVR